VHVSVSEDRRLQPDKGGSRARCPRLRRSIVGCDSTRIARRYTGSLSEGRRFQRQSGRLRDRGFVRTTSPAAAPRSDQPASGGCRAFPGATQRSSRGRRHGSNATNARPHPVFHSNDQRLSYRPPRSTGRARTADLHGRRCPGDRAICCRDVAFRVASGPVGQETASGVPLRRGCLLRHRRIDLF
jgi:hypothetical protein